MAPESYDAVIVGSGATGGWVAKELTEAGLNLARHALVAEQPVQVKCYQCDEYEPALSSSKT